VRPQGSTGRQNSAYRTTAALEQGGHWRVGAQELANEMAFYLVTGGAGFIGSHMVEALRRRGDRVRVADSLITGHRANLAHVEDVEFIEGDLADLAVARRAVDGVEYVLHQAAIPSVPRSVDDPLTSNRANIDATLSLLVAARDAGVQRVVYAGSSSAYGNALVLPKREDMPTAPPSPYALQKLVGEQYMQMFTDLYGLSTVTIRYFNVFGPRQDPASAYAAVIPAFFRALRSGEAPVIYGDGEQTRDFTFVDNVVDANLKATKADGIGGQVFNVASGRAVSVNALLAEMARLLGIEVHVHFDPARPGEIKHSVANIKAARDGFGYEVIVDLEEGLRRTIWTNLA
jgi:nucleoside-diphosphate-sugar epimerase